MKEKIMVITFLLNALVNGSNSVAFVSPSRSH